MKRIANIEAFVLDAEFKERVIANYTDTFIKKEVLAAETHIGRPISARQELLRDLSHVVIHYGQKAIYKLLTFVKGLNADAVANKLILATNVTKYVITSDFSAFDSS